MRRRERGNIIAIVAISLGALLAALGLAVDGGRLFVARQQLQAAADLGAAAGASYIAWWVDQRIQQNLDDYCAIPTPRPAPPADFPFTEQDFYALLGAADAVASVVGYYAQANLQATALASPAVVPNPTPLNAYPTPSAYPPYPYALTVTAQVSAQQPLLVLEALGLAAAPVLSVTVPASYAFPVTYPTPPCP